ncbi:MAG: hypothetical protein DA408_12770 [Bacteroidetes bacterium]|nr:MAG: hypothetical protein C7N36_18740 [Bacteroidota bacterium]PTM11802.1 MAG: hypothetical protein DA408_12770 [Bacteroidota bacterium]
MNLAMPYKTALLALSLLLVLSLECCSTAKSAARAKANEPTEPVVSYAQDIRPIMLLSCTPCHFPEQGRKEMLDTYAATREYITDILYRVQLPAEDIDFMPFKSKKPALTAAEIILLKQWVAQDMPQ